MTRRPSIRVRSTVVYSGHLVIGLSGMIACGPGQVTPVAEDTSAGETTTSTGAESMGMVDGQPDSSSGMAEDCVPAGGEPVTQDLVLEASDGTALVATVTRPAEGTCLPGLVLVHEFMMSRAQWEPFVLDFVDAGYVTLALDLRGHGDSDPAQGPLEDLLTDENQGPLDVAAGVEWLAAAEEVDPARIGLVGMGLGADLGVAAHHHGLVEAAVTLSPRISQFVALAVEPNPWMLDRVLCWATMDANNAEDANACWIVKWEGGPLVRNETFEDSSAHGVELFESFPEVLPQSIEWLDDRL